MTPTAPPDQVTSRSWLDTVIDWLRAEEELLSALAALIVLVGVALGCWRVLKGLPARRRLSRAARHRRLFADHIESQLRRLDEKEEWRDYRFARLEAEIESEGQQRNRLFGWTGAGRDGLRREKSLLTALRRSGERLIVLQGDPGAGKSISLRKVAIDLAREAMHGSREDSRVPLYVNLRAFRPVAGRIDAGAVREFVLATVNQANSRDVDRFLDAEFDQGLANGSWLFLFDSFDEIPDVLGADRMDETVERYADALHAFLHAMNTCRGVIASREFRGPRRFGWPRFTVLRLTAEQQRELIKKADLPPDAEREVLDGIASAEPFVARLTENPMLLGLLCEHVRETGAFPSSSHIVFETFVESRLSRDASRVEQRFRIKQTTLRAVAEEIAFQLTADRSLGLTPTRGELAAALAKVGHSPAWLDRHLDALEYIKLARAPEATGSGNDRPFTFTHRRFQEYFATCVVLREPERVQRAVLLLDGQWRETTVALLQTQPAEALAGLVADAGQILQAGIAQLPASPVPGPFPWPPDSRHVLSLLDAGTANRPALVPVALRAAIGELLRRVWDEGHRLDRKWAVESAALADRRTSMKIIEDVFSTRSGMLHEAAYQQAGRLPEIPGPLAAHMRRVLIDVAAKGRLLVTWRTIAAQLGRLANPAPLLQAARLLRWMPVIDTVLMAPIFVLACLILFTRSSEPVDALSTVLFMLVASTSYLLLNWVSDPDGTVPVTRRWTAARTVTLAVSKAYPPLLILSWSAITLGEHDRDPPVLLPQSLTHADLPWWMVAVVGVVGLYTGAWQIAVIWAIIWRVDVRPSRWLWLPVATLPALWRALLRHSQRTRLPRPRIAPTEFAVLLIVLAGLLALVALPWPARAIAAALLTVAVVAELAWLGSGEWRDWRLLRSLPVDSELTLHQVQEVVGGLRSEIGLDRFLRAISRDELSCGSEGLAFLEDLAARADERDSAPRTRRTTLWPPWVRQHWLGQPETIPGRVRDQIARLSEERPGQKATSLSSQVGTWRGGRVVSPGRPARPG